MQEKPARLSILIDPKLKKAFQALCASRDLTSSHMVRHLIHEYLDSYDGKPTQDDAIRRDSGTSAGG